MSDKQVPLVRKLATHFRYPIICTLVLLGVWPFCTMAQDDHSHHESQQQELTAEQKSQQSALIKKVREATERFKDVAEAERERYAP